MKQNNSKLKKEFYRFGKFILFSISASIIQTLVFTLLIELVIKIYWPSYLIAMTISVVYNLLLNRKYTFKSVSNIPRAIILVICYYIVYAPLSTLFGNFLTSLGWNEYLVLILTMLTNMEFFYDKYFVFRNSIDSNKNLIIKNDAEEPEIKKDNEVVNEVNKIEDSSK